MDMNVVEEFIDAIKQDNTEKNHVYSAVVSRIDDNGTVWVNLAGSNTETPTALSSTEVRKGDTVTVEWRNNKLYIGGNYSDPSAGSRRVNNIERTANQAVQDAQRASVAAASAETSAEQAQASATEAQTAATQAVTDAAQAKQAADDAQGSADEAANSAQSANTSAGIALEQLANVENIVGVFEWLKTHATYQLTTDTEVEEGKWYFTRSGTSPDYIYEIVNEPSGSPSSLGYYELVEVDEAVQDYVTAHMALDSQGLWLQKDSASSKVLISASGGLYIYGDSGQQLANYGTEASIGDPNGFHITISPTTREIGFWRGAENDVNNKVAYVSEDKLYITQSVVLQQMDIGETVANGGLGQWSWKVHEINGANNLYLKWVG